MQLMLHFSMDTGRDGGSQLLCGALEGGDQLSELAQQGVPCLLFSHLFVLHVGLQLLDICNHQTDRCLGTRASLGALGEAEPLAALLPNHTACSSRGYGGVPKPSLWATQQTNL